MGERDADTSMLPKNASTLMEALEPRLLLSADLVRDIDPRTASLTTLYTADLNGNDAILWTNKGLYRTDGTAAGTVLLREGFIVTNNPRLTRVGDDVYFTAKEPPFNSNWQLWKTDGTAGGTVKLATSPGEYRNLANCNGTLYVGRSGQLWKSNGTVESTQLVEDFTSPTTYPDAMTWYNGKVYFAVRASEGTGLWSTDGTSQGTTFVKSMAVSDNPISEITLVGGLMYFDGLESAFGHEPWRSDGSASGTFRLRDIATGSAHSRPEGFIDTANGVVFIADDVLYQTNGTTVSRLHGGFGDPGTFFRDPIGVGNVALFTGYTDDHGRELWRSDGTRAGTYILKDIRPNSQQDAGSNPAELGSTGSKAFFTADDGANGKELWISDGTADGTLLITDYTDDILLSEFVPSGNRVYFSSHNPLYGTESHVSDGTRAGTHITRDLDTTPISSDIGGPYPAVNYFANRGDVASAVIGNTIFFATSGDTGLEGAGLWKSDGTPDGTILIKQHFGSTGSSEESINHMAAWNGSVYFFARSSSGAKLWRSDGTPEGTAAIQSYSNNFDYGTIAGNTFVSFGENLYYIADYRIWRTDGTTVQQIAGGNQLSYLTAFNGRLFFNIDHELYVSDGTVEGTSLLREDEARPMSPEQLTVVDGLLYFVANGDLWRSDGSAEGTYEVAPGSARFVESSERFAVLDGVIYYVATSDATGEELWRSDGTPEGTYVLKDIYPNTNSGSPQWLTSAGNRLFFSAMSPGNGRELWVSDGTEAGTKLVTDLFPGLGNAMETSTANEPLVFLSGSSVFFVASDGVAGAELWQSAGSPETTVRVADLYPGQTASNPRPLAIIQLPTGQSRLLFSANHPDYGRELFSTSTDHISPSANAQIAGTVSQRSNLSKMTLKFTESMNVLALIASATIDDFIKLYDRANPTTPLAWLSEGNFAWDIDENTLTIDLTIDGPGESNSTMLANGRYELRVNTAAITDAAGNPLADTDGILDGMLIIDRSTGSTTQDFFRLGGDLDGDADVDLSDLSTLSTYYGTADPRGDADGDGDTDLSDLSLLSAYYGTNLPAPAPGVEETTAPFPTVQPAPAITPLPTTFTRTFQATNRNRTFKGNLLSLDSTQIDTSRKWKARIDWGDGSRSTEKVVYNSKTKRWEVADDHKYRKNGSYSITITLV